MCFPKCIHRNRIVEKLRFRKRNCLPASQAFFEDFYLIESQGFSRTINKQIHPFLNQGSFGFLWVRWAKALTLFQYENTFRSLHTVI